MKLTSRFIFFVLLLNVRDVFVNELPSSGCCFNKEVGNDRYVLVVEKDTSEFGCESNCVYEKDSEPDSRYCFKTGHLPFQCVSKQAPIVSTLSISEDDEELVQKNSFQNETGVLELRVPPHKNYTESLFVLHQDSKTTMLKTDNTCQLSDLPDHQSVSEMAENYEANDKRRVGESDKVTSFILKSRKARYGSLKRKALIPDVQYHCKDTPLVKTNDVLVNETEFEKYNKGEVIFLENTKSSRSCQTVTACSKQGPDACGYGFNNPDPKAPVQGFTFHQVSSGSVCVTCDIHYNISGLDSCKKEYCECKDITNKEELQICSVDSGANTTHQLQGLGISRNKESPVTFVQNMMFNKKGDRLSFIISSPAHNDVGDLEVVMHAREDGYWHNLGGSSLRNNELLRLGGVCHITDLASGVFPVDFALGIQEIKNGNDVTTDDDEEDKHHILVEAGPLEAGIYENSHPDIKSRCSGSPIKKVQEFPVSTIQGEDLKKGKIIFTSDFKPLTPNCQLERAARRLASGSWRFPNSNGKYLWVNSIVHSVDSVTCCRTLRPGTCCAINFSEYCACGDITDSESFNNCQNGGDKALFVATGVAGTSPSSSTEVLTEGKDGTYTNKKINIGGCSEIPDLPTDKSPTTGGLFNGVPHICIPSDNKGVCYALEKDGSWNEMFKISISLKSWVSSLVFFNAIWWIVSDSGTVKVLLVDENPEEESEYNIIKLPVEINQPCITQISGNEAFVTATPKFEPAETNYAWIFNIQSNTWTRLPNTLEKRTGPACGYIKKGSDRFVVLAGGLSSSSSELFNLDTRTWTSGPTLGTGLFGGSMVSVDDDTGLLLVGGYNGEGASSNILKMDSSMDSWKITGQLSPPKFNAVALAVPFGSLPPLCG